MYAVDPKGQGLKVNVLRSTAFRFPAVAGEATRGGQSPPPLDPGLAAGAAPVSRVPSSVPFTDGPLVTALPCAGPSFHRRPGGSSWFTSLPQRSLIAASTSKPRSKSKE